jgi:hypothetical protein
MSVIPLKGLGPIEQAVQERSLALLKTDKDRLIVEYIQRYGIQVGTDLARELFPEYALNLESRLRFATSVQRAASALADMVFDHILEATQGGSALFTAGGTGAGKTTSILQSIDSVEVFQGASVIFDGNFNSFKSSKDKVDKALQQGCKVVIIFVHRHPVEAYMQGVIPRAIKQGRTVPIDSHLRMHKDSISNFLKVMRTFKDNKNVSSLVLNNTGHEQETFLLGIDYLRSVKYDSTELAATIQMELKNAFEQQSIPKAIYEASSGIESA